jgi:hypothetical protein
VALVLDMDGRSEPQMTARAAHSRNCPDTLGRDGRHTAALLLSGDWCMWSPPPGPRRPCDLLRVYADLIRSAETAAADTFAQAVRNSWAYRPHATKNGSQPGSEQYG